MKKLTVVILFLALFLVARSNASAGGDIDEGGDEIIEVGGVVSLLDDVDIYDFWSAGDFYRTYQTWDDICAWRGDAETEALADPYQVIDEIYHNIETGEICMTFVARAVDEYGYLAPQDAPGLLDYDPSTHDINPRNPENLTEAALIADGGYASCILNIVIAAGMKSQDPIGVSLCMAFWGINGVQARKNIASRLSIALDARVDWLNNRKVDPNLSPAERNKAAAEYAIYHSLAIRMAAWAV